MSVSVRRSEHLVLPVDLDQRPQPGDVEVRSPACPARCCAAGSPGSRASSGRWRPPGSCRRDSVLGMPKPSPRSVADGVHLAQRHLLEEQRDDEADDGDRHRAQEHRAERVRVGVDDRRRHRPADSSCSACGDCAAAGGAPLAANAGPIRPARKLVNSEPKIAAPKELPMVRKNVTPEVATPRSAKLDGVLHDQDRAPACTCRCRCRGRTGTPTAASVGVAASIRDSSTNADGHHRGADDGEDLVAAGAARRCCRCRSR